MYDNVIQHLVFKITRLKKHYCYDTEKEPFLILRFSVWMDISEKSSVGLTGHGSCIRQIETPIAEESLTKSPPTNSVRQPRLLQGLR